jgi:hypothetical protein
MNKHKPKLKFVFFWLWLKTGKQKAFLDVEDCFFLKKRLLAVVDIFTRPFIVGCDSALYLRKTLDLARSLQIIFWKPLIKPAFVSTTSIRVVNNVPLTTTWGFLLKIAFLSEVMRLLCKWFIGNCILK